MFCDTLAVLRFTVKTHTQYTHVNTAVRHCLLVLAIQAAHGLLHLHTAPSLLSDTLLCCTQHNSIALAHGTLGAGAESEEGVEESPGDCRPCCGECSQEHQLPVRLCGALFRLHHPAPQPVLLGSQAGLLCGRYTNQCWSMLGFTSDQIAEIVARLLNS